MIPLNIPAEHLKIIEGYSALSAEQKSDVISRLSDVTLGMTHSTAAEYLSKSTGVPKKLIHGVLGVFFNLLIAKKSIDDDTSFLGSLRAAIDKIGNKNDDNHEQNIDFIINDLISLVNVDNDNLVQTNKVIESLNSNQRIFVSSDIKMDLRPVFDDEKNGEFIGFVKLFNLKINVQEDGEDKSIFIALDAKDIESLRDSISAVEKQAATIAEKVGFEPIEIN